MKAARIVLAVIGFALIAGIAGANTLKDDPPTIFYPEGHYLEGWPRTAHRDMFGYNYQRHRFVGYYANVYLGGDGYPPYCGDTEKYYEALVLYGYADTVEEAETMLSAWWYWEARDIKLVMYWNDAWLSNQDRGDNNMGTVPDGNLDRHYGYPTYFDSEAVLIQLQVEPIEVECRGRTKTVNAYYYSKLVAVPSTAVLVDDIWYTADGEELGPEVYGSFARVKVYEYDPTEDPCPKPGMRKAFGKRFCEMTGPVGCGRRGR